MSTPKGIAVVEIEAVNISPLLVNAMTDETLDVLKTGVGKQVKKDAHPKDVAESRLYRDETGKLVIPTANLFAAIVEAGRKVKSGKSQISTATTTTVPSFLNIIGQNMVFTNGDGDGKAPEWVVDKRRGCLPKDGTAVCLIRPRFEKWGFKVRIEVDETVVGLDTVAKLLQIAGEGGLCDFRPGCKGPFGRFRINSFRVVERKPAPSKEITIVDETVKAGAAA